MKITREYIIDTLTMELQKNDYVVAFWLEGADAHNRVDEYSDIDMWFDVRDGREDSVIEDIESILSHIAPVDYSHEIKHSHPNIRQKFFHLEGTSEFLIIDVGIQSHSREFWYTNGFVDEKVKIIFEKEQVIEFRDLDTEELQSLMRERILDLEKTFLFFQVWVKKALNRDNFLEALSYYHKKVLEPLIELLRIRFEPTKHDFGLKHVKQDLPKEMVERLEVLYKVNSIQEISQKIDQANQLFFETLETIER